MTVKECRQMLKLPAKRAVVEKENGTSTGTFEKIILHEEKRKTAQEVKGGNEHLKLKLPAI